MWDAGNLSGLWEAAEVDTDAPPPARSPEATKAKGAIKLTEQGKYSRAMARLLGTGVHDPDDSAIIELMRSLHPSSPDRFDAATADPGLYGCLAKAIEVEDVWTVLNSFDTMTASGNMGLKVPHLKLCVQADPSEVLLGALRRFILSVAVGEAPEEVRHWFAGGRLTGIKKPDSTPEEPKARPVCAGELLRRIVAKALNRFGRAKYDKKFLPLQFGVGAKCGTERVIHAIAALFGEPDTDDLVLCKMDMKNAFNLAKRLIMRASVDGGDFGHLLPFVTFCYGVISTLYFGGATVESSEGTQQGDPLASLLFALVIHPLAEKIESMAGIKLAKFFLDDGNVAGPAAAIKAVLDLMESEVASDRGLILNPAKTELIWRNSVAAARDAHLFPVKYTKRIVGNFSVLGTPIGTSDYVMRHVEKEIMPSLRKAWISIEKLEDRHVALSLLRQSAHPSFALIVLVAISINSFRSLSLCTLACLYMFVQLMKWLIPFSRTVLVKPR
jgi:hypothetical protein